MKNFQSEHPYRSSTMPKQKKSTKKFLHNRAAGKPRVSKTSRRHRDRDEPGVGSLPRSPKADKKGGNASSLLLEDPSEFKMDIDYMDVDEFLEGNFLEDDLADDVEETDDDGEDEMGSSGGEEELTGAEMASFCHSSEEQDDEKNEDEENGEGMAETSSKANRRNQELKDEVASHKAQLEALRDLDPEFYAYLQATDQELLEFGNQEEGEEEEDADVSGRRAQAKDDGDDGERSSIAPSSNLKDSASKTITMSMVNEWCTSAKAKASLGALRHLLRAYRVACHYGDSEESIDESFRLGSSAVYSRLMSFVLQEFDSLLRRALDMDQREVDASSTITSLPRWKKLEPLAKSYLGNTLHLLGQMKEPSMLAFVLRRLRASVVFFAPFAKLQRRVLKSALELFGSADAAPRVQAILFIRAMAISLPPPTMDTCLKGVYRAFSSNAKFVNAASAPHINFMAACVVEMYGLDASAAYQHAFGFIRQLAVLLRHALTSKSKESYKEMYCWQTMNCLELWAKVLATHADSEGLRPLIHPVTQLLIGTARLVPTPAYFPLRIRCVRALNKLAESTGGFVPIAPLCLEILQWRDLSRAPKSATGSKSPDILMQLRAGKTMLRSPAFQEELLELVFGCLADHLAQWGYHVAFPELAHLTLQRLRRFAKTTSVEKFRRNAKQLADAIDRNITFVGRRRDAVSFAPKDLGKATGFLASEAAANAAPIVQHAITLRERAQQRAALRQTETVEIGEETVRIGLDGSNGDVAPDEEEDEEGEGEDMKREDDEVDADAGVFQNLKLPRRSSAARNDRRTWANGGEAATSRSTNRTSIRSREGLDDMLGDVAVGEEDEVVAFELSEDEDGIDGAEPLSATAGTKASSCRKNKQKQQWNGQKPKRMRRK